MAPNNSDAERAGPATRRLLPATPRRRHSLVVLLAGFLALGVIDYTWRELESNREIAHGQQVAGEVGLEISARVSIAERTTGALGEAAKHVLERGEQETLSILANALFEQAPSWFDGLAVLPVAGSSEPRVVKARNKSIEGRYDSDDVATLVREVQEAGEPRLALLEDGRVAFARPVVRLAVTRAVAIALLAREPLLSASGTAAYRVRDGQGRAVFSRDGEEILPGEDIPGYVRTVRPGHSPWTVEVHPAAVEHGPLHPAVVGGGLVVLVFLSAWLAWDAKRRREVDAKARLYRTLFEVASDLVFVVDENLRLDRANSEAERLFEIWEPKDYGRPFLDTLLEGERDTARSAFEEARNGLSRRFIARVARRPDTLYEFRTAPILINDELIGIQVLAADVTEREEDKLKLAESRRELEHRRDELYKASITDPLTGVYNRRHLEVRAAEEVERARRYGRDLTCLFLDLDHFKIINDTWGHGVGDDVLRIFASLLQRNFRRTDIIGRYGGEEFVVLLTETPGAHVYPTAQKILRVVRETDFPGIPPEHRVTVSIGAAVLERGVASSTDGLFAAADEALYEAKGGGRDRMVLYKNLAA